MTMQLPPTDYMYQVAKQRMSEMQRSHQLSARSKQNVRHVLASGLRKLADWLEPALTMRVPVQRRPA